MQTEGFKEMSSVNSFPKSLLNIGYARNPDGF
jgi:hypothetical protein